MNRQEKLAKREANKRPTIKNPRRRYEYALRTGRPIQKVGPGQFLDYYGRNYVDRDNKGLRNTSKAQSSRDIHRAKVAARK